MLRKIRSKAPLRLNHIDEWNCPKVPYFLEDQITDVTPSSRVRPDGDHHFMEVDRELGRVNRRVAPPVETLQALAHTALQSRGLIGIVLGSIVHELYDGRTEFKNDKERKHKDFDVLVLTPHSPQTPFPREWGIDWFTRLADGVAVNDAIQLYYDLKISEESTRSTSPGLYLPHPQTMRKVVEICNGRQAEKVSDYEAILAEAESLPCEGLEYELGRIFGNKIFELREKIVIDSEGKNYLELDDDTRNLLYDRATKEHSIEFEKESIEELKKRIQNLVNKLDLFYLQYTECRLKKWNEIGVTILRSDSNYREHFEELYKISKNIRSLIQDLKLRPALKTRKEYDYLVGEVLDAVEPAYPILPPEVIEVLPARVIDPV